MASTSRLKERPTRAEAVSVFTAAVFDASDPLTRGKDREYSDSENPTLTAFVGTLWAELHSIDATPVPPCPHCKGARGRLHQRANEYHRVPYFRCSDCRRLYTRLTGSPVARLRFVGKMPEFFRLLSQAVPLEEASRRLGVDYGAISNWLMRFRQLIALHDPDLHWTPLVRLGLKYRPHGACPKCDHEGQLNNGGFSADNRRQAKCPACAYVWALNLSPAAGAVPVIVASDLALNAAERRRRAGLEAPDLPRVRVGSVRTELRSQPVLLSAPDLLPPDAGRFDFRGPLRDNSPLPRKCVEDEELTRFLKIHVDQVLSDSIEPPPCPHCGSHCTRLASAKRATSPLPQFQCRACARLYSRTTRTPLANMLRKDILYGILPLLSQHRPLAHAADQLGTTPEIVKAWVRRFREWLLVLNPAGDFERRVRLGLKAPRPVLDCPHCRKQVEARPHGFKRTRKLSAAELKRRLFRCTECNGFFDVSIDAI
ncbi:DUF746 domain-containing protein [Paraburkholderia fungorum]|uniref:DUF746 domain-containing protein n=1 Tax=Paraburkholderia fungorum TaxID=134537 RepID=UPI003877D5C4